MRKSIEQTLCFTVGAEVSIELNEKIITKDVMCGNRNYKTMKC